MRDIAAVLVDGDTRREVEHGTPDWHASMEWARFHGLDPNRIPMGHEVVRDAARCAIEFDEFVFDDDGKLAVDHDDEVVIVHRVEQGEAPPLPFDDRRFRA